MTQRKKVQLTMHPSLYSKIVEMSEFYALPVPELMRKIFADYYTGDYRRDLVGYKGVDSIERKNVSTKKVSIEAQVEKVESLSDEASTKYIHDIGYISIEEESGCKFVIDTDVETGVRGLIQKYDSGGSRMCYTMAELKNEIRKFIKKNK